MDLFDTSKKVDKRKTWSGIRGIRASGIHPINIFNFRKILLSIVILERGITDVNEPLAKERPGSLNLFTDAFKWETVIC